MSIKELSEGWSFTEIGCEGAKDRVAGCRAGTDDRTVELLKAEKVPRPSRSFPFRDRLSKLQVELISITIYSSSSGCMSEMGSVDPCSIVCNLTRDRNLGGGRREGMGFQFQIGGRRSSILPRRCSNTFAVGCRKIRICWAGSADIKIVLCASLDPGGVILS